MVAVYGAFALYLTIHCPYHIINRQNQMPIAYERSYRPVGRADGYRERPKEDTKEGMEIQCNISSMGWMQQVMLSNVILR